MTQTLAQLVSSVQAQLIDDGTRFTTPTITAAVRSILARMNKRIPIQTSSVVATVANQLTYEVAGALYVTDVLQQAASGEQHTPLGYDPIYENGAVYFKLRSLLNAGVNILARYAKPHTVNGLDSETTSTLTADQDQVLIDGACAEAMSIRGAYIAENNNLNSSTPEKYAKLAQPFESAFEVGLRFYERHQGTPSVGRVTAWNDEYHGWTI